MREPAAVNVGALIMVTISHSIALHANAKHSIGIALLLVGGVVTRVITFIVLSVHFHVGGSRHSTGNSMPIVHNSTVGTVHEQN